MAAICPPCPQTTDSTLSIVANVTGILTFAIATAATYIGYLLLFASADGDQYSFEMDALNRFHNGSQGPFNTFKIAPTGDPGGGLGPTQEEMAVHFMNESLDAFETLRA